MPIRSGAMQRPSGCRCGNTLRQRYDEVGLPCSSTMGSPSPTSTYAISLPRTRRRFFLYGNAAEIMFALLYRRRVAKGLIVLMIYSSSVARSVIRGARCYLDGPRMRTP